MRTMKTFILVISLTTTYTRFVNAKYIPANFAKEIPDPKDVGRLHTDAFEKLTKKYESKLPSSVNDVTEDMTDILRSYCPDGNLKCREGASDAMNHALEAVLRNDIQITFPANIDDALIRKIDNIFETVDKLDENNLEEVIEELTDIQTQLDEDKELNPFLKYTGTAAASVSIESSKLWHSVWFDENHVLNKISFENHRNGRRDLQSPAIAIAIAADVAGFLFLVPGFTLVNAVLALPALIPFFIGLLWVPVAAVITGAMILTQVFLSVAFSTVAFLFGLLGISLISGNSTRV